jgi:hypothetical protein
MGPIGHQCVESSEDHAGADGVAFARWGGAPSHRVSYPLTLPPTPLLVVEQAAVSITAHRMRVGVQLLSMQARFMVRHLPPSPFSFLLLSVAHISAALCFSPVGTTVFAFALSLTDLYSVQSPLTPDALCVRRTSTRVCTRPLSRTCRAAAPTSRLIGRRLGTVPPTHFFSKRLCFFVAGLY